MPKSDQKTLDNIKEYGCHVLGILEGDDPSFTYSIGIYETQNRPELIIVGLEPRLAQSMVNKYNRRLREGETFIPGNLYEGFLEGFNVCFIKVAEKYFDEYPLACNTHYGHGNYEILQLVWPTTGGQWPWDEGTSQYYKWAQPILNETGIVEKI